MNNVKIIAIIVLFNPDNSTVLKQYNSLLGQVDSIIYIDNNSININEIKNNIISNSQTTLPFQFIFNKRNMGLGYAHNQGIQLAKSNHAEFVLILDHDSVLKPGFTNALLKGMYELNDMHVGAVGPIYINESTNETYPITRYVGPFIKRLIPTCHPVEASCLISSGSLIPISVLDKVGGMNEDLFVDYIDIEWSYRTRFNGYKLYAIPQAVMNHQIGDRRISVFGRKISMHSPLRRYYLSRNSIFMLRSPYITWGYKLREFSFNICRIFIYSIISKNRVKYLKYSFMGIWDGLRGKFGECSIN